MWRQTCKMTILVLLILSLTGCIKSADQQILKQLELGQKYLTEENYEEAIVAFQKVIDIDPKSIEAWYGLALAQEKVGDEKEFVEALYNGILIVEEFKESEQIALIEESVDKMERLVSDRLPKLINKLINEDKDQVAMEYLKQFDSAVMIRAIYQEQVKDGNYGAAENLYVTFPQYITKKYPDEYMWDKSDSMKDIYEQHLEKLSRLYEIAKSSGVDNVKDVIKKDKDYFNFADDSGAINISAYIETDFYYGAKIYYGECDERGKPEGFGVALCYDNGYSGQWLYVGEWENGKRSGEGSLFNINLIKELSSYDGNWSNDKPNGVGSIYEESRNLDNELVFWEKQTGQFVDGYYNGNFVQEYSGDKDYAKTGHIACRLEKYDMGRAVPIEEGTIGIHISRYSLEKIELDVGNDSNYIFCRGCETCIALDIETLNTITEGVDFRHYMPATSSSDFVWTVFGGFDE